jgi:DNA-binding response OmpR family regulator
MAQRSKILLISGAQATVPLWAQDLRVIPETNPGNALKRWAETGPDVIVFDAGPEARPSLDEVRRLRQEAILPILMLCSIRDESFLLEAYAAGVDECVLKPISPALLQAKIRAWLRRSWSLPADLLEALTVGDANLIPSERSLVLRGGQPIPLTNLEMRLLYYLMSRPGRTAQVDELCQRVWGYDAEGDQATLKSLVYRLRRKIEADPAKPQYLQTVTGVGYKFSPSQRPDASPGGAAEAGPAQTGAEIRTPQDAKP